MDYSSSEKRIWYVNVSLFEVPFYNIKICNCVEALKQKTRNGANLQYISQNIVSFPR